MNKEYMPAQKMKENELVFQNNKYGRTPLNAENHKTTQELFGKKFLTPKEEGGTSRGLLFKKAVSKLLQTDIEGKKILDYCCGRGDLAIYLSQHGAEVYGFDISKNAIQVANLKAAVNQQKIDFRVMDAENLNYPDQFFDYIIGFEALHHVILYENFPPEMNRVLKKGGKIIFAENWGGDNVLFQLGRKLSSLKKHKSNERGEVILNKKLITQKVQKDFCQITVTSFSLFYTLKKYINNKFVLKLLRSVDDKILKLFPFLSKFCGEAVIILRK